MPQYRRNTANTGMKHQSINQNLKKVQEEHTIHVHVITIKILTLESFKLYLVCFSNVLVLFLFQ